MIDILETGSLNLLEYLAENKPVKSTDAEMEQFRNINLTITDKKVLQDYADNSTRMSGLAMPTSFVIAGDEVCKFSWNYGNYSSLFGFEIAITRRPYPNIDVIFSQIVGDIRNYQYTNLRVVAGHYYGWIRALHIGGKSEWVSCNYVPTKTTLVTPCDLAATGNSLANSLKEMLGVKVPLIWKQEFTTTETGDKAWTASSIVSDLGLDSGVVIERVLSNKLFLKESGSKYVSETKTLFYFERSGSALDRVTLEALDAGSYMITLQVLIADTNNYYTDSAGNIYTNDRGEKIS